MLAKHILPYHEPGCELRSATLDQRCWRGDLWADLSIYLEQNQLFQLVVSTTQSHPVVLTHDWEELFQKIVFYFFDKFIGRSILVVVV